MDFLHINMPDSPTISLTSSPTVTLTENTEEYQTMFTNTTDTKTPQRPSDIEMFTITNMTSTLIMITIPHIETQAILYDDDKLPDLTQVGTEQKGSSNTYVDISDDEPTFLDDEVIVNTNDNKDIVILHEEPSPIIKFLSFEFGISGRMWTPCTHSEVWYYTIYKCQQGFNRRTNKCL